MFDPNDALVIVNPAARGGWVERRWSELSATITRELGRVTFVKTRRAGEAVELARRAALDGAATVVSYGGDGTHSEVTHGLMQSPKERRPALGILHAGTGGDFRKLIVDGHDLALSCRAIAKGEARPIDVGSVEFHRDDGSPEQRYFLNICSLGISGLIDRYVNASNKRLGGTASFALATLKAQLAYRPARVRIEVDAQPLGEMEVHVVCVCNGRYAGGGMMFAPEARLGDGLFDVVIIRAAPTLTALPVGMKLYSGKHLGSELVTCVRGKDVRVATTRSEKAFMDVDGEAPGVAPAHFRIHEGAVKLHGVRDDVL